jgi:hypothetical protein
MNGELEESISKNQGKIDKNSKIERIKNEK